MGMFRKEESWRQRIEKDYKVQKTNELIGYESQKSVSSFEKKFCRGKRAKSQDR